LKEMTSSQLRLYFKKINQREKISCGQFKTFLDFINDQKNLEQIPPIFVYNLTEKLVENLRVREKDSY
jgi:hypothetical protein